MLLCLAYIAAPFLLASLLCVPLYLIFHAFFLLSLKLSI